MLLGRKEDNAEVFHVLFKAIKCADSVGLRLQAKHWLIWIGVKKDMTKNWVRFDPKTDLSPRKKKFRVTIPPAIGVIAPCLWQRSRPCKIQLRGRRDAVGGNAVR